MSAGPRRGRGRWLVNDPCREVEELRFLASAKLFELGRLSSGKAARLAGLDRVEFLQRLGRIGVAAINLADEEVEAEIEAAKALVE